MDLSRYASRLAASTLELPKVKVLHTGNLTVGGSNLMVGSSKTAVRTHPAFHSATTHSDTSGAFLTAPDFGPVSRATMRFPHDLLSMPAMPEEGEDAHLTGGTRSLSRRLLALNVPAIGTPQFRPQLKAARSTLARKSSVLKSRALKSGVLEHATES